MRAGNASTPMGPLTASKQLTAKGRTMANKLADARQSLIRAREAAQKRLEELDNERREIRASLKSLDAALAALEKSSRRQTRSRSADGQSSNTAPNERA